MYLFKFKDLPIISNSKLQSIKVRNLVYGIFSGQIVRSQWIKEFLNTVCCEEEMDNISMWDTEVAKVIFDVKW